MWIFICSCFREFTNLVISNPEAEFTKSVVIVNGVNHGQFASGEMPPNVIENDIASDLSETEAFIAIADATVMFMDSVFGDLDARERLHKAIVKTNDTFNPLLMAEDFEFMGTSSELAIYSQESIIY